MMRVTTIYAGSAANTAAYYTKYLTQAVGELPGEWLGAQATRFGLSGAVTTEQLETLLSGRDPVSGTALGTALIDRTMANGTLVRAVGGFDATLSAPKSLSAWWALSGDDRLADCHDVAVRAVADYLQRLGATTRIRSNGGRLHPDSEGLTMAAFRQSTSRADDPQLHTHLVVSGKVQTEDGRWFALDARFLKQHQRALGGLYQSVLRAELTHRFGVAFGPIVNGQAEIAGVPQELLDQFSKRAGEVDRALAVKLADFIQREGRAPSTAERAAMTREAAADTRQHKTGLAVPDLRTRWLDEAADLGVTPASLRHDIGTAARTQSLDVRSPTVEQVIEALADERSSWHRMDVLRTVTDLTRPQPGIDGRRWVAELDRAVDAVLTQCIDLDPTADDNARRRVSDGRSVWLEPVASHMTAAAVIRQEEWILSYAIDMQMADPSPSTTIERGQMDVLQTEAAAAVAGDDRLVLVVGPAGTGKTTMLRAAVDDLDAHDRDVFGVAPTAKAARVLDAETGMPTDTLAKLLHEWTARPGGPQGRWRLPRETTVVLDEAGMVNTADLHTLVRLAERNDCRLALIGDGHQLQAVGRGGMFTELCSTGRVNHLDIVHRFAAPWEAAASLRLRHGDRRALDLYEAHDRIVPGAVDEHLATIAERWTTAHAVDTTLAVTTTRNDDVDKINDAVQQRRLAAGDLDPSRHVEIAGGAYAYLGDVIATRRNDRRLTTTDGDTVRNRDLWTVTALGIGGDLTVTHIDGHGTVTLPADFVREHVRLGYATTEHGNQGTTTHASLTLVTDATTGRGLYVGATRGRTDNAIFVVTDTPDPGYARDILERVLSYDRADLPAIAQRRELAAQPPPIAQPVLMPRCSIPPWVGDLRAETLTDWRTAKTRAEDDAERRERLVGKLGDAFNVHERAETAHAPFARAIDVAQHELTRAKTERATAKTAVDESSIFARRAAKQQLAFADDHVAAATAALDAARAAGGPTAIERNRTALKVNELNDDLHTHDTLQRFNNAPGRQQAAEVELDAIDTWRHWAEGRPITPDQTIDLIETLDDLATDYRTANTWNALATPFRTWAEHRGIELPTPDDDLYRDSVDFGIEL